MSGTAGEQLQALAKTAGIALVEGDGAPVVRIESDLNVTAARLGEIVARLDLYEMNGEMIFFDWRGERQAMTPKLFCTWINDSVVIYDRIRENMRRFKKMPVFELLNISIWSSPSKTGL